MSNRGIAGKFTELWSRIASVVALFRGLRWRARVRTPGAVEEVLRDVRARHKQPAMGAALIQGDEILAAAGGRLRGDSAETLAPGARFHIGSVSKSMTAMLTAILVREGRLSYELTLAEALPDLPMRPEYEPVTIRQLMLNRAGLIAYQRPQFEEAEVVEALGKAIPEENATPDAERAAAARFALMRKPVDEPGTRALYSNVGWSLLGLIAETRTGTTYEELLKEKIFGPLGMDSARVGGWPAGSKGAPEANQPWGHYPDEAGPRPHDLSDGYVLHDWMNPAGGVQCSIHDFARYAREHLKGLQGRGLLLGRSEYEAMHSIHMKVSMGEMYHGVASRAKLTLGYGWAVIPAGKGFLSAADGSGGTFYARVLIFPEADAAFVGFTNSGDGVAALGDAIYRLTGLETR